MPTSHALELSMAKNWTKLSKDLEDKLVTLVEEGHFVSVACANVGISRVTLHHWMRKGEAGDERYAKLYERIRAAESVVETHMVTQLIAQSRDNWLAGKFYLERRFPERWSDAKVNQAKLDAERETILDALVRVLDKRGLADTAEEVISELAATSSAEAEATRGAARPTH